jgi:hypothetical protein
MIPSVVLAECRTKAKAALAEDKPRSWIAAFVIVSIWLGLGILGVIWLGCIL